MLVWSNDLQDDVKREVQAGKLFSPLYTSVLLLKPENSRISCGDVLSCSEKQKMPIFTRMQPHKHESKDLAHRCDETQTPIHYLRHRTDYYSSVADNIADAMPLLAGGYIEAITSCARPTTTCRNVTVTAQDTRMVISAFYIRKNFGAKREAELLLSMLELLLSMLKTGGAPDSSRRSGQRRDLPTFAGRYMSKLWDQMNHKKQWYHHCSAWVYSGGRGVSTLGPYRLTNHSVLGLEASNMVLSSPSRPTILATMSVLRDSARWQTSSASIMIISAPASKHLSALLISRSTSSTLSARVDTKHTCFE